MLLRYIPKRNDNCFLRCAAMLSSAPSYSSTTRKQCLWMMENRNVINRELQKFSKKHPEKKRFRKNTFGLRISDGLERMKRFICHRFSSSLSRVHRLIKIPFQRNDYVSLFPPSPPNTPTFIF